MNALTKLRLERGPIVERAMLVALPVLLFNLPFLTGLVPPHFDTNDAYRTFYVFYSGLINDHSLPHWLPYGFYGMQNDIYFLLFTPPLIVAALAGYILNVHNALLVFSAGVMLEQFVLIYGTYLLGGRLFRERYAVIYVCFAVLFSTVFVQQLNHNFRIYYLLPLMLYFLHGFLERGELSQLLWAGVILLMNFIGVVSYAFPLNMLIAAVFVGAGLLARWRRWREYLVRPGLKCLPPALSIAALAAVIFVYKGHLFSWISVNMPGRQADGTVTLGAFLNYAMDYSNIWYRFIRLITPLEVLSDGVMPFDFTVYVGPVVLLLAVIGALWHPDRKTTAPLIVTVILLGLFSIGKVFFLAEFLYDYFPLMKYFRYLYIAMSPLKVLAPVLAGFGLEVVASALSERKPKGRYAALFVTILLLAVLAVTIDFVRLYPAIENTASILHYATADISAAWFRVAFPAAIAIVSAGILFYKGASFARRFTVWLLVVTVMTGAGYQFMVHMKMRRLVAIEDYKDAMSKIVGASVTKATSNDFENVRKPVYYASRMKKMDGGKTYAMDWYIKFLSSNVAHVNDYNFLYYDPCLPSWWPDNMQSGLVRRHDFFNTYVTDLLAAWGVLDIAHDRRSEERDNSWMDTVTWRVWDKPDYLRVTGCGAPKMYIAASVADHPESEDIREIFNKGGALALTGVPQDVLGRHADAGFASAGSANVEEFTFDRVKVAADVAAPFAWLYYADAYHPGWKARVDGVLTPVYRANHAFKAVLIEKPGHHVVEFYYEDPVTDRLRLAMAAISIAFMGAIMVAFFAYQVKST